MNPVASCQQKIPLNKLTLSFNQTGSFSSSSLSSPAFSCNHVNSNILFESHEIFVKMLFPCQVSAREAQNIKILFQTRQMWQTFLWMSWPKKVCMSALFTSSLGDRFTFILGTVSFFCFQGTIIGGRSVLGASWSHTEILRFSLAASSRCLSIDMTHEKQESPNHRCRYHPEPASSTSTAGIWTSPWERVALCAHGHAQEHLCATKLICVKVTDQIAAKGLEFNQLLTQKK